MNDENLIPFDQRSESEARESGRKGGIASGESRRKAKTLAEAMKMVAFLGLTDEEMKAELRARGVSDENMTNAVASSLAVVKKALGGDVAAYNAVRDMLGEKPTDKTQADIDMRMRIEYVPSTEGISYSEEEADEGQ